MPAAPQPVVDESAVKAQIDAEKAKRRKEKAELETQLAESEQELKDLKAREATVNAEKPKIEQQIAEAKKRQDESYQAMTDIEAPYRAAEQAEKEAFTSKIIAELQAKYDAEYNRVLALHVFDTNYVTMNRMQAADFNKLTIPLHDENPDYSISFDGAGGNSVSGWFMTMDFDRGKEVWRQIPAGATFSVSMQRRNPFVADVLIRFGADFLACGSTNVLDWDVHFFVGKDFDKKEDAAGKFFFVGVTWPVDLGRPVCWQKGVPPVYDVTPRPVRAMATDQIPEIAQQVTDWKFDDPGWKKKKNDAYVAYEAAKRTAEREVILKDTRFARVDRKLGEIQEKIQDCEQQVATIKAKLVEYEEEETVEAAPQAAPADAGSGAGSATNVVPQEGL